MTDEEYSDLRHYLATYPDAGDPMSGVGGVRKLRWANSQRGKGKRSGSRTIYLHVALANMVHLLMIYDHEEKDDLTKNEREELATFAHEMKILAKKGRKS
ncbi:MAG: hypothetical protein H0W83_08200 [Planctomycetes bacterium]|nr:hypothetical protein [Planctomycetota bacterium]